VTDTVTDLVNIQHVGS